MWRLSIISALLCSAAWGWSCPTGYAYERPITVNSGSITGTLFGFPMLVVNPSAQLKSTANGGHVQNANGYDVVFVDAAGNPLPFELVGHGAASATYSPSTGNAEFWVNVSSISDDTKIYLCYGNPAIDTYQGDDAGTWDANFKYVIHAPNGNVLSAADSTGTHTVNLDSGAPSATAGKVGGAIRFAGNSNSDAQVIGMGRQPKPFTICTWANFASHTGGPTDYLLGDFDASGTFASVSLRRENSNGTLTALLSNNTPSYRSVTSIASMGTGIWTHVCAAASNSTMTLYVNGVPDGPPADLVGLAPSTNGSTYLALGRAGAYNTSMLWNGSLDEIEWSAIDRGGAWISAQYKNQNAPNSFYTVGPEASAGGQETSSLAPAVPSLPLNSGNYTFIVTGAGTNWDAGTTFSISGVSGVSLVSQSVLSPTSALLGVDTGNITGSATISDGTLTASVDITSPGLSAKWSGPWRYNTRGTGSAYGDTWIVMQTVNGLRVTCNDCKGIDDAFNSNVAFLTESADLERIANKNGLSGLGVLNGAAGYCNSGASVKSASMISFANLYVLSLLCQAINSGSNASYLLSTAGDDGAHWARSLDRYAASSCSCTSNTVTCTTAPQSLAVGDRVIATGIGVAGNEMYQLTSGTSSTTVKFSATCSGDTATPGSIIGPATDNAIAPTGTPLFNSGSMIRIVLAQICTDNINCSAAPDHSDAYLVGVGIDTDLANPMAFRILKSDFLQNPNDASKYQWSLGENDTWTSTQSNGVPLNCIIEGVKGPCQGFFNFSVSYLKDAALPDGGQYLAAIQGNASALMSASHIYGPWLQVSPAGLDTGNPPVPYNFIGTVPFLYTANSSNPYQGTIRMQGGGAYSPASSAAGDYSPFHWDLALSLKSPNQSRLFNLAPFPGMAGAGGPFRHIESSLQVLWQFPIYGDATTSPDSIRNIPLLGANFLPGPVVFLNSPDGMRNFDPTINSYWGIAGGATALQTGFGQDLGDFSVLFVGKSDLSGTQVAMAGPMNSTGAGFGWRIVGGTMRFSIRGGASVDLSCPAPSANTFFAYIGIRKGGTTYCFKSTDPVPTSATGDSTTLGSYTLRLGSASDQAANYWRGTMGEIAIWNRALCSRHISGSCRPGAIDEVQREFAVIRAESRVRGWNIQ